MKNKIKNFLLKKRIKILRNNKGLSIIEIMVALGLIGILAAVAVPQYRAYQREVRYGVVRSMVTIPFKTIEIEESVGKPLSGVTGGFLWSRVKSKDKSDFEYTFDISGSKWCFLIEGKSGTSYNGYESCIDEGGTSYLGGTNIPCSQAEETQKDNDMVTVDANPTCTHTTCASLGCALRAGETAPTCTDNTVTKAKCDAGTSEVYQRNLTCSSGECA